MSEHGVDFCPHTVTHPILARLPFDRQLEQVRDSREVLERKLGRTPDIFCYPNGMEGDFNEDTMRALQEAGYVAAVTAMPGFNQTTAATDPFRLRRFSIPDDSIQLKQYVSGLEAAKNRIRGSQV